MRLYEISWALIHNYPNCFNHPSLQNHSISQSINRGLGVGINQSRLERKVMMVVYLQKSWSSRTQSPLVAGNPCLRSWVVLLSHSLIVNKENSSSNLVLSLFHVLCLMNVFDYMFDILFI